MKYQSAGAFRAAINARLKAHAREHGEASLARVRRHIVFDRLLARIARTGSEHWVLKGALALDYRLGERARSTRDLDLLLRASPEHLDKALQEAIAIDLNDFFSFSVQQRQELIHLEEASSIRYHVLP